jgi:endophilin-A
LDENIKKKLIENMKNLKNKDLKEVMKNRKKMKGRRMEFECKRRRKEKGYKIKDEEIKMYHQNFEQYINIWGC